MTGKVFLKVKQKAIGSSWHEYTVSYDFFFVFSMNSGFKREGILSLKKSIIKNGKNHTPCSPHDVPNTLVKNDYV